MTVRAGVTQPMRSTPLRFRMASLIGLLLLVASGGASAGEPTVYMLWVSGVANPGTNTSYPQVPGSRPKAGVYLSANTVVGGVGGYQLSLRFDMNGVDELNVIPSSFRAFPPANWSVGSAPTCTDSATGQCPGYIVGEVDPIWALDFTGESPFSGQGLLIATVEFDCSWPGITDGVDVEVGFFNPGDGVWTASGQPTSPSFSGLTINPLGAPNEPGPCTDFNYCTSDTCSGGGCTHAPVNCGSPLTSTCSPQWGCGSFAPATPGGCQGTWNFSAAGHLESGYARAGAACNDGNACTASDVCNGGATCSGTPISNCGGLSVPAPTASPGALGLLSMLMIGIGAALAGRQARRNR